MRAVLILLLAILAAVGPGPAVAGNVGGEVTVEPFELSRSLAGELFAVQLRDYSVPTSGNGRYTLVFFNPANSGKTIFFEKIVITHAEAVAGNTIRWTWRHNTVTTSSGTSITVRSLNAGNPESTVLDVGQNTGITGGGKDIMTWDTDSTAPAWLDFGYRIALPPGKSTTLFGDADVSATEANIFVIWMERMN